MAIAFLTITPLGTATPSVSRYVAGVERILRGTSLVHQLTAMGTIIEGDLDRILAVVREMHEAPFGEGALRVSTLVKIDDRRDKEHTIARKMRSVEEKLRAGTEPVSRPRRRRTTARRARR
jgi:uncharacterized protein (TIGR00106 family)